MVRQERHRRKHRTRRQYEDPYRALASAVIQSAWHEAEKNLTVMRTTRDEAVRQRHLEDVAVCYRFLETATRYHQFLDLDPRRIIARFRDHVDPEEFRSIQHIAASMP